MAGFKAGPDGTDDVGDSAKDRGPVLGVCSSQGKACRYDRGSRRELLLVTARVRSLRSHHRRLVMTSSAPRYGLLLPHMVG